MVFCAIALDWIPIIRVAIYLSPITGRFFACWGRVAALHPTSVPCGRPWLRACYIVTAQDRSPQSRTALIAAFRSRFRFSMRFESNKSACENNLCCCCRCWNRRSDCRARDNWPPCAAKTQVEYRVIFREATTSVASIRYKLLHTIHVVGRPLHLIVSLPPPKKNKKSKRPRTPSSGDMVCSTFPHSQDRKTPYFRLVSRSLWVKDELDRQPSLMGDEKKKQWTPEKKRSCTVD